MPRRSSGKFCNANSSAVTIVGEAAGGQYRRSDWRLVDIVAGRSAAVFCGLGAREEIDLNGVDFGAVALLTLVVGPMAIPRLIENPVSAFLPMSWRAILLVT